MMSGSSQSRYVRLDVIGGENIQIPSRRIPAGIYVYIKIDSRRRWKSAIKVLSSDGSAAWRDTVTLYNLCRFFLTKFEN
ncbi:hypothetical protein CY34DRAFT_814264 [Suillus luteus UH-Slu-Lm8-n1]|uniref:Uncharacterized protein n=1 Tax=Suillus luteus UH-Slu-Lm8-n1 TaxID=930992 RepID=A0A0D0A2S8_9AGAM|nr:hypothetical protein CY34DRAFT_814264 [Suillus luteus UH-Slu-Lm8-n1]